MRIDVLTLFPEVFEPFFGTSIVGRAVQAGVVEFGLTNYRDFTHDRHRSVDDSPFGGGPGMVMMCGPVFEAVEHVATGRDGQPLRILLTPQGETFNHSLAREFASVEWLMLICGHYEGFDERIRTGLGARQLSIGDYVLSGGEAAAMVVVDAVVRQLPGALGDGQSAADDSFSRGLLEYPQYTRPREFRGMEVPEVLLSGDHARIEAWRREQALERTRRRRPDLMGKADRTKKEAGEDVG
jgi:tRNA (guanine37-N1)-methyltransferase